MIDTLSTRPAITSVASQLRRNNGAWRAWAIALVGVSALVGLLMARATPSAATLGWFCFFAGIGALLYKPRYGVYQIAGLALAGDAILTPWFPFVKNLSSAESLLYVGRATSFSPAEIFIVLTFVSWLSRAIIQRRLNGYTGALFWPVAVFAAFITFGLIYGITHHGDRKIALWEVRVIYYLPAMLILTSNLITTRAHLNTLIWTIVCALFFDSISGIWYIVNTLNFDIRSVEAIAEHSNSIHLNTVFVLAIGVWMYRGSKAKRIILPLMLPIILISYFANQRRAAFITLTLALVLIGFVLFRVHRRIFWMLAPTLAVLGVIYLGAFWNSTGGLGMPARAIRSIIAPQQGGRDDASNAYRVIENVNTKFTIQSRPLTGIGFGNKFYIVVPMPDISFFEWWEYITHNSIMWIWMQTGVGGFLAMLVLVGMSVIVGMRALWRMPGGDLSAITLMVTLYVIMHFVYAYVDMSWEAQSMIYVGVAMGIINCIERVADAPLPLARRRWPWQTVPSPIPGLRPAYEELYATGKTGSRSSRGTKRATSSALTHPSAARPAASSRG